MLSSQAPTIFSSQQPVYIRASPIHQQQQQQQQPIMTMQPQQGNNKGQAVNPQQLKPTQQQQQQNIRGTDCWHGWGGLVHRWFELGESQ